MSDDEIPEYIIRAERNFVSWATKSPVYCMAPSEDKSPERKLEIFEGELQYHLGAFTAAQHTCNSLYKIEGYDRYYPESFPPWMEEAVEYKEQLYEEMEDDE